MLPRSAIAGGETMERMIADMGPLLELKRDISAFYRTLANKRQQVRAENGGQDRKSQLASTQPEQRISNVACSIQPFSGRATNASQGACHPYARFDR